MGSSADHLSDNESIMRPLKAVIDLSAIAHNLGVAKRLSKGAKLAAAIKANAYGHGITAVLPALQEADWLAVACIEEAIVVRDTGNQQPILLLEGVFEAAEYAVCQRLGLEPVIHCQGQLDLFLASRLPGPLKLWLKLDSGMGRLGLSPSLFEAAISQLADHAQVAGPLRLMTHFAASDEADSNLTQKQWQLFKTLTAGRNHLISAANSGAALFHPTLHGDIVRPGLMLYGAGPNSQQHGSSLGLRPAMRLETRIIAIREVPAGAAVGYGASWIAPRNSLIATAAVGYGDGYPRAASNRAVAMIRGQPAPLAGRVSMDMIGIDVTDIAGVDINDPVLLWGQDLPIERLAEAAGTIPYEVMCGIQGRVARDYLGPDTVRQC